MGKKVIPDEIREEVIGIVERYNQEELNSIPCYFIVRFKGKFLYLDRSVHGKTSPICRLKYQEDFDDWDFAIYKWSSKSYDSEDFLFDGSQYVDGTIAGAIKAGMHAYPV
ncbi:hypothetical protein [Desulfogranum japonicum]|uniref:hypothetical protein n=1 Tax=Desulfogranum japonicum TaxID=231447 RepID=UPI0004280006|nr:hypothetical protein [Desulfogranum japonicum]